MARLAGLLATFLLALACAPAALAHSGGVAGTDFESTVKSTPPGLEARIVSGDDRIELRRTGDGTYVVIGYEDEPFIKLSPEGVFQNEDSPSVELSLDRIPSQALQQSLNGTATGEARWKKVSGGSTYVYHDHRTHWMSTTPPAVVREDPGTPRVIFDWSVPVEVAGAPARDRIRGQVAYVPPPASALWWAILGVAVVAAAALAIRLRAGALPRLVWAGFAVAATASIVVLAAAASDEPGGTGTVVSKVAMPLVIAGVGIGIGLATRRTPAIAALGCAGAALLVVLLGVGDRVAPSFAHAVLPSALPATAVRALLVVAIAGLAATVVGAGRLALAAASEGAAREPAAAG